VACHQPKIPAQQLDLERYFSFKAVKMEVDGGAKGVSPSKIQGQSAAGTEHHKIWTDLKKKSGSRTGELIGGL
jgi:hypothetical protein